MMENKNSNRSIKRSLSEQLLQELDGYVPVFLNKSPEECGVSSETMAALQSLGDGISESQQILKDSFELTINNPKNLEVTMAGRYHVGKSDMYSFGYFNCVGIILMSPNRYLGLTHNDNDRRGSHVDDYIPEIMYEMRSLSHLDSGFKYFIFGGDREHMKLADSLLQQEGAKKIGQYLDDWSPENKIFPSKSVITTTKCEAILYDTFQAIWGRKSYIEVPQDPVYRYLTGDYVRVLNPPDWDFDEKQA